MNSKGLKKPEATVSPPLPVVTEGTKYVFLLSIATFLFLLAFLFNSPSEILRGNLTILTSPANLITDYFALANIGATLVNASLMMYKSIFIIFKNHVKISGTLVAAIFTVAGFSFFGKNLYNSIPIVLGVFFYSVWSQTSFHLYVLPALFGSALGPIVSEITFNLHLPLPLGIVLGILAGIASGFVIPPLANHFLSFHKGFSHYNIGFTAGIIGTFFIAVLRSFGFTIDSVNIVSSGNNVIFSWILYSFFTVLLLFGLFHNHWSFKGYRKLLAESGRLLQDFVAHSGFGLALINMGLLGLLSTSYILMVDGELSGPIIGGIFTVVGFGAAGKHIKNVLPIFVGVFFVGFFNAHDLNSTSALLAALFGTTLAPISGYYGTFAGIVAGGLHMAMVMNISYLHAGMNLYNNGFSGGFIAAALVPLLEEFRNSAQERREWNIWKVWRMNRMQNKTEELYAKEDLSEEPDKPLK